MYLDMLSHFRREVRYVGTPRNISRHVVMSDFDDVTATLPRVSFVFLRVQLISGVVYLM